jgi:uncharacterized protein
MTRFWRKLILNAIRFLLVAIAVLFTTTVYAQGIEPRWFEIKTIDVQIAGLDPVFDGYKIVQLTDLHARSGVMDRQRLEQVARIANQQQPDLIALTGDYITLYTDRAAEEMLTNAFGQLKAKDGAVAIMGNHERGQVGNVVPITNLLQHSNITLLNNAVHSINRSGHLLNIAGVDDVWMNMANLPVTIAQLPKTGTNILLAHEPDFGDIAAATNLFGLQLSGHSHGGQIALPFFPKVTAMWAKKYINGLYKIGSMQLYVSRGVGTTGKIQARFNCRPEIAVIILHRKV